MGNTYRGNITISLSNMGGKRTYAGLTSVEELQRQAYITSFLGYLEPDVFLKLNIEVRFLFIRSLPFLKTLRGTEILHLDLHTWKSGTFFEANDVGNMLRKTSLNINRIRSYLN